MSKWFNQYVVQTARLPSRNFSLWYSRTREIFTDSSAAGSMAGEPSHVSKAPSAVPPIPGHQLPHVSSALPSFMYLNLPQQRCSNFQKVVASGESSLCLCSLSTCLLSKSASSATDRNFLFLAGLNQAKVGDDDESDVGTKGKEEKGRTVILRHCGISWFLTGWWCQWQESTKQLAERLLAANGVLSPLSKLAGPRG